MEKGPCFFCGDESATIWQQPGGKTFECEICGIYTIPKFVEDRLTENPDEKYKYASLLAERKLNGLPAVTLGEVTDLPTGTVGYKDFLDNFPRDFFDQHDRSLLNIAALTDSSPVNKTQDWHYFYGFCNDSFAGLNLLKILQKEGLIDFNGQVFHNGCVVSSLCLTIDGFKYVTQLKHNFAHSRLGFVAMWFSAKMNLFVSEVKKAISTAGYEPFIANEDIHCDQIMPRVINKIREARFVIADLSSDASNPNDVTTGVRGGVYFEAGLAKGAGIPVIYTCRKSDEDRIHFDLKQVMHIPWEEKNGKIVVCGNCGEHDFCDVLKEFIIHEVGEAHNIQ